MAVEQHEQVGGAIRDYDRADVGIGWVAKHQAPPTAVINREDLDRPQPWIFGEGLPAISSAFPLSKGKKGAPIEMKWWEHWIFRQRI